MAFDLARATKYFLMWDFIKGFSPYHLVDEERGERIPNGDRLAECSGIACGRAEPAVHAGER